MPRKMPPTPKLESAEALLAYLGRSDYRPLRQAELLHRLHISKHDRTVVRRWLRRLIDDGRIVELAAGRLALAPPVEVVEGTLTRHRLGFAYVVPQGGGREVFLGPEGAREALSGDHVAVRVRGVGRDGRVRGVLVRVVEARGRFLWGLFRDRGPGGQVEPFDAARGEPVDIERGEAREAKELDVVRVEILTPPVDGRPPRGRVERVLGHIDDPGIDVQVVVEKYRLPSSFPDAVLDEASSFSSQGLAAEARSRQRFDDPAPVTIDGETAKDFDDAVAVAALPGGGYRLHVHVADVAHFAREGGALDTEARQRGTSVYFPTRVLPMFPEALSNDLCSLVPGEDRLVQTAILDIDADGEVQEARFTEGVIRSAARLTYRQVADLLSGAAVLPDLPPAVQEMLRTADRLRELLQRRRRARGSIDFDLPEPLLLLDVEGAMTGITLSPRNSAHFMIEEFMLAANEAVARHLEARDVGAVFRIHEAPDPTKIEALARFVEPLGLDLPRGVAALEPAALQRLLTRAEELPQSRVIHQVTLRSMKQARYSARCAPHFGLATPNYCHFTSPIRRYPDLIVHRCLRRLRQRTPPEVGEVDASALEALALQLTERERNAEAAERELLNWKKIAFIARHVGESFDGLITGVARFGLFVQLVESLVEGLVHVEQLGDERFEHLEDRLELVGTRSGRVYRVGDTVRARVARVDRALLRVDLVLEVPEGAGTPRRARGSGIASAARGAQRSTRRTAGSPRRRKV